MAAGRPVAAVIRRATAGRKAFQLTSDEKTTITSSSPKATMPAHFVHLCVRKKFCMGGRHQRRPQMSRREPDVALCEPDVAGCGPDVAGCSLGNHRCSVCSRSDPKL